jgi:hypothetical protein
MEEDDGREPSYRGRHALVSSMHIHCEASVLSPVAPIALDCHVSAACHVRQFLIPIHALYSYCTSTPAYVMLWTHYAISNCLKLPHVPSKAPVPRTTCSTSTRQAVQPRLP